jgi:hypothetical protein
MLNKDQIITIFDMNESQIEELIRQKVNIWSQHVVFSGLWWMGVALTIIPWILWYIYRRKQSVDRMMYAGVSVMVVSIVLDLLGDQLGLWNYRFNVIPVLPTYVPWDLTLMPVSVMVLLQIKPKANPWVKAILFALVTSYLAEPFFTWLKVYNPVRWPFSYSVPIQVAIYMVAHYVSRRNKLSEL